MNTETDYESIKCNWCPNVVTIGIRDDGGYEAWKNGAMIQNAMPYLTADEREMLISGTCPQCWEEMFS